LYLSLGLELVPRRTNRQFSGMGGRDVDETAPRAGEAQVVATDKTCPSHVAN